MTSTSSRHYGILVYGLTAYALFHAAFLYLIGFVSNFLVPKGINGGEVGSVTTVTAIAINLALIAGFGIQHAIMARQPFKAWLSRIIPAAAERSTFMIATCTMLGLIYWFWQPLPSVLWSVDHPALCTGLWIVSALGWGVALVSTFLIDHFELFGLRQSFAGFLGRTHQSPTFKKRGFYKVVRHPLMTGFMIAFWATPHMTLGHMVFALGMSGYILIGVTLEERDLMTAHPRDYAEYRHATPMLLPRPKRARPTPHSA